MLDIARKSLQKPAPGTGAVRIVRSSPYFRPDPYLDSISGAALVPYPPVPGAVVTEREIRTPYLEFDPDNFRAETDSRVQIRIGSRSLTATGMLALLQEDRLELKSNVSGKFVP